MAGELVVLSTADRKKRDTLIEIVTAGERCFIEVGNALRKLRDEKLYVETHGTFEAFCQDVWGFAKSRAYQLIDSASIAQSVSTIGGQTPPKNERQVRALAGVTTPQKQATVWAKAVESAPKGKDGSPKVTAAHVKKVAEQIVGKLPAKPTPVREPGDDTESIEAEKTKRRNNGRPVVDSRKKKAFLSIFGKLVRLADEIKIGESCRHHFEAILAIIKGGSR